MSFQGWFLRRNVISQNDLKVVLPLAAVSGVVAGLAGCHPTGQSWLDPVLTGALVALSVWLGASASWWSVCGMGLVIAASAGTAIGLAAAVLVTAIGLYLGSFRQNLAWLRSVAIAIGAQMLLRLEVSPFFGASALIAGTTFILMAALCLARRRRPIRRRVILGATVLAGGVLVAAVSFGARVYFVRGELQNGYQGMLTGLSQLQGGDARAAAVTLHEAAAQLNTVADAADSFWTQPARLVPVVAQHRNALAVLVEHAADAADAAATALDATDLDSLTIEQGVIDVTAVATLEQPLGDLAAAVDGLRVALDDADSPWLIRPVAARVHRYQRRAEQATVQARASATAAAVGPAMLGADGTRAYFIGFVTPAEARAEIGMIGDYALITINHGQIRQTDFGRANALGNEVAAADPIALETTPEFRSLYGSSILDRDGSAGDSFWSNVTINPDTPTAAAMMAEVWERTGHRPVDGVFLVDPTGLAAILSATGPVAVEGLAEPLNAENVERFLYLDQYQRDTVERTDLLEAVATATLDAMLGGQLPAPQQLARSLGPAATGGHIVGWARRPEEQELMRRIGMDGALPPIEGSDGLAVVTNNAGANKIDSFLQRTISYDAHVDRGLVTSTLKITLRNNAPTTGYPTYVIGSEFIDMPLGTNRTMLSVYTPLVRTRATLDGEVIGLSNGTQQGWNVYGLLLDLEPGSEHILTIELVGEVDTNGFVLRPQSLPTDDIYSIEIHGDLTVSHRGPIDRTTEYDADGSRALRR